VQAGYREGIGASDRLMSGLTGSTTWGVSAGASVSPFVGRDRELAVLRGVVDRACVKSGGAAFIVGEAGIGKSRLAAKVASYALSQGVVVRNAVCFEGEWSPPFGPWLDALGDIAGLSEEPDLEVFAELWPEVRRRRTGLGRAPRLAAPDARFRAKDALARLLIDLAGQPLLVVIDDLQWVDAASLELLSYLGRFLPDAPVAVLGAYRDETLELAHPLNRCLAELDRCGSCVRVRIDRLSDDEARSLVAQLSDGGLAPAVETAIVSETAGHPFFLVEVVEHVVERAWPTGSVPDSVRHAVAARLARLPPDTQHVLSVASVFSRPFELVVLCEVVERPVEQVEEAIDQALRARMVRQVTEGGYDFAHALVRRTLYDELGPSRRARLNRRVAQALERVYAGRELEHAGELATYYDASSSLPGSAHGLGYAIAAADGAAAAHGHEQAVSFLEMARRLGAGADAGIRAEIECRIALAEADALWPERAERSASQALALLGEQGASPEQVADFVASLARRVADARAVARRLRDKSGRGDPVSDLVERGLATVGARRDLRWARLRLLQRPIERVDAGPVRAGRWIGYDPEAVDIARAVGSEEDYARTLSAHDLRRSGDVQELLRRVEQWSDPIAKIRGLDVVTETLAFRHGDLRASRDVLSRLIGYGERVGSVSTQAYAFGWRAAIEATLGAFDAADRDAERATELRERLSLEEPAADPRFLAERVSLGYTTRHWRNIDWEPVGRVCQAFALTPGPPNVVALVYAAISAEAFAKAGDPAQSGQLLEWIIPAISASEPTRLHQNGAVGFAGSAVWQIEARRHAAPLRKASLALLAAEVCDSWWTSIELTVARMSSLLGENERAADFFGRARTTLEASGQRPLRAVVDYDEARHRVRHGLTGSKSLLVTARDRFVELGMDEWIERADRLATEPESLPHGVTAREGEVLRLLARGQTNAEIADTLIISVHTVERHLANIYRKIGARNRAEATAYTLHAGL
jgi:DNA-binding CsgD family transcriptional regulator